MRIVVNGQQAFGKSVLDALLERGEHIVGVYCSPEKEGQRADPLKEAAVAAGIPVFQPASFKKPEVWEEFRALKPDLGVMAYVIKFVPSDFLNIPTHGTIQYHPSLLPLHRGPSSINWPIIMGSKKTGLTIFWPDDGLDTGPVLLQKEVDILPDDTLGSVYFDKLFPLGVAATLEAVDMVKAGTAPRIVQDESKATYESWCKPEDVKLDWSQPAGKVYDMIRGANPQPGAWTEWQGKPVQIFDSRKAEGKGTPGQVLSIGEDGMTVAAGTGAVLVQRVRAGGPKITAAEFAAGSGLTVGAKLG